VIERLTFDSNLFGRPIGILKIPRGAAGQVAELMFEAQRDGYQYLICKPAVDDAELIHALGSERFYLSDQGLTWATELSIRNETLPEVNANIVAATRDDVPSLQRMIRSMFVDSRFYHDPFFTWEEADRLHEEWIKNSVDGVAADHVLYVPERGFVTLKVRDGIGEIVLIGVAADGRRRGLGRALLAASLRWFTAAGLSRVTVRTQVRNLRANNFYRAHGFALQGADVSFSRML
jgi:ribosomal protein S18 acetylase RimI-like enzyme